MEPKDHKRVRNWKTRFLNRLGFTNDVIIKVYHGYGHPEQITVYGHVFRLSPLARKKYRKSFFYNTLALLRLFIVKPYACIQLEMKWGEQTFIQKTDKDGFFKFSWKDNTPVPPGWHEVNVQALIEGRIIASGKGKVYFPFTTQYGFISDIDDTFLISHSSNLRKRLFVLFTENAHSRKPFEGSVNHYQLLSLGNTTSGMPNPFFYVSSSEWNLYDYILEFTIANKMPQGVFLLNQLKEFTHLLKTGQSNHHTKFTRIARIIESYPLQKFILLGDSSQQDPYIYEAIASHFPNRIHAIYIRDIHGPNRKKVMDVLDRIKSKGISCCFFKNSSEAISHSQKIGLINNLPLAQDYKAGI
jgi:phosphatidate phosphatase APP1